MQWSDVTAPPSERTLRQFAGLCLIISVSVGTWQAWHQRAALGGALIALGVGVGGLGWARPAAIRWLFAGWMIAAFPVGWTISQVMLAGLFYAMFTPVAVAFRLVKRDALRLRRRDRVQSYWTPKPGAAEVRDYFRQF
jgi:hypothetical protein